MYTDDDLEVGGCLGAYLFMIFASMMIVTFFGCLGAAVVCLFVLISNPYAVEFHSIVLLIIGAILSAAIFWALGKTFTAEDKRKTTLNDWKIKSGEKEYRFRGRELSQQYYLHEIWPNGSESENISIYKTDAGKYILNIVWNHSNKKIITCDSPKDVVENLSTAYLSDDETKRKLIIEAMRNDGGFRNSINSIKSIYPYESLDLSDVYEYEFQETDNKKNTIIRIE
jgi:hypothetical protein